MMSAFRAPWGAAYADANHGGQEVTFSQTAKTVPASINDQMSSFTCKCQ